MLAGRSHRRAATVRLPVAGALAPKRLNAMLRIERISDYLRISNGNDDDWILFPETDVFGGMGTCGPHHFWLRDRSGRLDLYHFPTRRRSAAIELAPVPTLRRCYYVASRDSSKLFVFNPEAGDASVLHVIAIASGTVEASYAGLPRAIRQTPVERPDGTLVMHSFNKRDHRTYVTAIDPSTGAIEADSYPEPEYSLHFHNRGFLSLSPDGRYIVKPDHTRLDIHNGVLEKPTAAPGSQEDAPRYGVTFQIWEALPLRFVRRAVVAWMRDDEMPDETHLAGGMEIADNDQARRAIWHGNATAAAKTEPGPLDGPASRAAYPQLFRDSDSMWRAVEENFEKLMREPTVVGWEPDGTAFWVNTNEFLSCVGIDGTVSPRLYTERLGLRSGSWLPRAVSPSSVTALAGRKARVEYPGGAAIFDGSPSTDLLFPHAIPLQADGWVRTGDLRPEAARASAEARVRPKEGSRQKVVVNVSDWTEAGVTGAIEELAREVDENLCRRAVDGRIEIVFLSGSEQIAESVFFTRVRDEFPGAVGALRRLISRYVEVTKPGSFLFSAEEEGVGLFAAAVMTLGVLDQSSIPILKGYGDLVDTEHEHFFAGRTVPAAIAAHGWNAEMIDFVFWVLIRNYYNALENFGPVWSDWGLRDAVIRYDPISLAQHVAHEFKDMLRDAKYRSAFGAGGLIQLAKDIPHPHEPWAAAFFAETGRLLAALDPQHR